MAVRLHRCGGMGRWLKIGGHACWRVERELQAGGIEYEAVYGPVSRRLRGPLRKLSGQSLYPVIEFEDGSVYREQSKRMAETIREGRLDEMRTGGEAATDEVPG